MKLKPTIDVFAPEITVGEDGVITVTVPDDATGTIIVGPPSGGTVDFYSPNGFFSTLFGHYPHDVRTYEYAKDLERVSDYYSVRPSW